MALLYQIHMNKWQEEWTEAKELNYVIEMSYYYNRCSLMKYVINTAIFMMVRNEFRIYK